MMDVGGVAVRQRCDVGAEDGLNEEMNRGDGKRSNGGKEEKRLKGKAMREGGLVLLIYII